MGWRSRIIPLAGLMLSCAWVPLSGDGQRVRIATYDDVTTCRRVGHTAASVPAKLGFIRRSEAKVSEELDTLARNEAARSSANAVVPESAIEQGRREFGLYSCPEPADPDDG